MDSTNSLVILKGKVPFTNSLVIAEGTDNEHRAVLQLIRKYEEKFNRWGAVRFTHLKCQNPLGGRPTTIAFLNEQQATFLITLLRNTDVVLDFKAELVDQFYKMHEIIARQQNAEWLETRKDVKVLYRKMTDSLKVLVDYARAQGSTNADKLYMTYNKLINKSLGINAGQRDSLTIWQLHEIEKMQSMIETIVKGLIAKGTEYHQIYKDTKQMIESYSALAYFNGTHVALRSA